MYGTVITAAIVMSGATLNSEWEISCLGPMELLLTDLRNPPQMKWPVPGSPVDFSEKRRPWLSVSLMPDLVSFESAETVHGKEFTYSPRTSMRGLKGQLLKTFGLLEERSAGFGATFRFAGAPNWAFQLKGTKRFTVGYITRF